MLIINFEGRKVKCLLKSRYDETFAGEDGKTVIDKNLAFNKFGMSSQVETYCTHALVILTL